MQAVPEPISHVTGEEEEKQEEKLMLHQGFPCACATRQPYYWHDEFLGLVWGVLPDAGPLLCKVSELHKPRPFIP